MKTIAFLLLSAFTIFAQGNGNFLGSNLRSIDRPTPQEIAQQKATALGGHIFRRVNGEIYNFFQAGEFVNGVVTYVENGVLIVQDDNEFHAIKNYKGDGLSGKRISVFAVRKGTYIWSGSPCDLYDCGTILTPDEEGQQEQALRDKMAADAKSRADAIAAARNQQRIKSFLIQSNAVLRLQMLATNGEVWAQCSLGEHYLTGIGCETNRALAIKWLTTAAGNGDMEASNTLARLKP